MTFTVNGLLAFQRLAHIAMLPAHLRIRPQLLHIADQEVPLSPEEHDVLTEAGLLTVNGADPDAATVLRALAHPDAEVNLTLGGKDRAETYICLARRHQLFVAAARCGEEVTVDAFTHWDENRVVAMLSDTVRAYVFDGGEGSGLGLDRAEFPLDRLHSAMCAEEPAKWPVTLQSLGVSRQLATVLVRSETELLRRAEIAAYLNHEVARSNPDTIVRVTSLSSGALMTSFASDNNGQRWLTVEDYESARLDRAILAALRSVPGNAWFSHSRSD